MGSLRVAACTAQHRGDRVEQQDRVAILTGRHAPRCALGVLADGLGGRSGGAIAAENALLVSQSRFDQFSPAEAPQAFFRSLVEELHIVLKLTALASDLEPHSTYAAVLIQPGRVDWCHVGDSRIYHFRDGAMLHCTEDHTLARQLVRSGHLPAERASRHPSAHRLLHSLGSREDPEPDFGGLADPRAGDAFLICSDGLWSYFGADELGAVIASHAVRESAGILVEGARQRAAGRGDNCSLVLMRFEPS